MGKPHYRLFLPLVLWSLLLLASQSSAQETSETDSGQPNRLASEPSVYLQQHAHNPVDWYPWGEEALEKARRENKPILLSIGYSSCHWCHVMEKEAFSDPEIAKILNEHFVCIKVDREERPDVDHVYMTALQTFQQMLGQRPSGGWPLNVFLTPDAEPFFGGTYFPARDGDRGTATGFLPLITNIRELWRDREEALRSDAKQVADATRQALDAQRPDPLFEIDPKLVTSALEGLSEQFDETWGGFQYSEISSQVPKFPEPANLMLLLELERADSGLSDELRAQARRMLLVTLDRLQQGGIHDVLAGGFHRYSTDRFWRVPHFEKMLYDNAQLLSVFAEAAVRFERPDYRHTARSIADFMIRDLSTEHGLAASIDADSEGEEGRYYVWEQRELRELLTEAEFASAAAMWGVAGEPNFEEQFHVLAGAETIADVAQRQQVAIEPWLESLEPIREKLLAHRIMRVAPRTDSKFVTAWNALAIAGLADAGRLLNEPEYVAKATAIAEFITTRMVDAEGNLHRTLSGDSPTVLGFLDDYACTVHGLLTLHRATGDDRWLQQAATLHVKMTEFFEDAESGGFFMTHDGHDSLLARAKDPIDSVIPAANSLAATNAVELLERGAPGIDAEQIARTIRSVGSVLKRMPEAMPWMILAIHRSEAQGSEGESNDSER